MKKATSARKQRSKIKSDLEAALKELAAIKKSKKKMETLEMFLNKL